MLCIAGDIGDDEKNLLYVAITRAKKQVFIIRDVINVLSVAIIVQTDIHASFKRP